MAREVRVRWKVSSMVAALSAAEAVISGKELVDASSSAGVASAAEGLKRDLESNGIPLKPFFHHAIPLAGRFESNAIVAETVLTKICGRGKAASYTTVIRGRLGDLLTSFQQHAKPPQQWTDERVTTIQRGYRTISRPILATSARLTDDNILVEEAEVVLIPMSVGAVGVAHLPYNTVRLEPSEEEDPRLTDELRLCWLLSQLNLDLPMYSEDLPFARRDLTAALAMIPIILAADVELTQLDPVPLETALRRWMPNLSNPDQHLSILDQWWTAYRDRRPAWSVGFRGLERLLPEA